METLKQGNKIKQLLKLAAKKVQSSIKKNLNKIFTKTILFNSDVGHI